VAVPGAATQHELHAVSAARGASRALGKPAKVGLTVEVPVSKFEGLPRDSAERPSFGARPLLENSTACQKSMPKPRPGSGEDTHSSAPDLFPTEFLWYMTDN
jgi:hypothetical protein